MSRSSGSLTDRPWGVTLAKLGRDGFTGMVTVVAADKEHTIAFDLGAVVGATSPVASDAIARIALTSHLIASSHVVELTRRVAAEPDRDDVELLAEAIGLAPDRVATLRERAVLQRAARTFSLTSGAYIADDRIAMPPGASIDVRAVIYQGARKNLSEQALGDALRAWGARFTIKPDAVTTLQAYGFGDEERPIIAALLAGSSIPEIEAAHRDVDPRTVQAVVYALASYDACEVEHRTGPVPRMRHDADMPLARVTSPAADGGYALSGTSENPIARTQTRPIPAVEPTPTREFIGEGTPNRPSSPPRPDAAALAAGTESGVSVPRTMTPRPASGAYSMRPPPEEPAVGRVPTRQPVTGRVPTGQPVTGRVPTRQPITGRVPTGQPITGRVPTGQPALPRTTTARRVQALIAARTILLDQGADHFAILGVPFDAPPDVVRTAYLTLVGHLHPDKLAELEIADTAAAQRLFSQIGVAFSVLTDPAKREAYLHQLALAATVAPTASATIAMPRTKTGEEPASTPAAEAYQRGQAALRRDDPRDAVVELFRAVQLEPTNVDYQAMLGWAQFCAADDRPAVAVETRKALEKAIQKSAKPLGARFLLGRVERMLGRDEVAQRHFQMVLDEEPNHADAASEVRAIQIRLASNRKR